MIGKVDTRLIMLMVAMLGAHASVAASEATAENYFERSAEGWFWYVDPELAQDEPEYEQRQARPAAQANAADAGQDDPLAQLKRIQETIARAEARAVLYPTEENVREYLRLNQWRLNQSSLFSDVWRRVVWQTPSLDYSLRRPVTNLAVQEFHDQRRGAKARAVARVAKTHGLFFFFKGSCPYCHTFGPILRRFSQMYGIEVLPISLDGGMLPDFPRARTDTRVAAELGVTTVPSVFLVDPYRRDVIPVGVGVMSIEDLAERIYVLTQTEPGEDY